MNGFVSTITIAVLLLTVICKSNQVSAKYQPPPITNLTINECQYQLSQFKNGGRKLTLTDACVVCQLDQTQCHCSKLPSLCENVQMHNTEKWKRCDARWVRAIFNFIFGLMGITGNSLVVAVTIKFKKTLSRCHLLIGGLALSDLVFSISQAIRYVPLFWTCQWLLSDNLCTLFPLIKDLSSNIAVGYILIIATERFSLIVCPHRKPLNNTAILAMCIVNVLLGILACIPKVLHMTYDPITGHCHSKWENPDLKLTYDYVLMIVYFLLPVVVIAYEHLQIVDRLQQQQDTINKAKITDRNLRRNQRITRLLLAIVVGYVLLVFPKKLVCTLKAHMGTRISNSDSIRIGLHLFSCLPYGFHVALNPILYSFFDRRFRKHVRLMLPCAIDGPPTSKYDAHSATTTSTKESSS